MQSFGHAGMDGRHPGSRRDASGNIHADLGSSTRCWNDAIAGFCLKLIEAASPLYFSKEEGAIDLDFESRTGYFDLFRSSCFGF
jgi:hypothetical protein